MRAFWAPALQSFAVLAGDCGLDEALERLDTRLLPASVVVKFAESKWTIDDLPPREAVEEWLLGARVLARRGWRRQTRRGKYTTAAKALGITVGEARRAESAFMLVAGPLFRGKLRRA